MGPAQIHCGGILNKSMTTRRYNSRETIFGDQLPQVLSTIFDIELVKVPKRASKEYDGLKKSGKKSGMIL